MPQSALPLSRRALIASSGGGLAAAAALPGAGAAHAAAPPDAAKVIIHTFLKARPQLRADLGRFIALNWLVMDRIGIEQGIFTHAVLHEVIDPAGETDFVMEVGYLTQGGYPDVQARFMKIREAHKTVLVNGKDLNELGTILGESTLRPVARAG